MLARSSKNTDCAIPKVFRRLMSTGLFIAVIKRLFIK